MRHGKKFNHLGRKAAHRKAMLANMACSLIEHKRIKTTVTKAKALRKYVEPLITKSKNDTTHSRRTVFSYLKQKEAITELFGDVASKIANREGGYTRILKIGNRLGDNAEMCIIELVDYNDIYTSNKPKKKTKSTRRSATKKVDAVKPDTSVVNKVTLEENLEVVDDAVSADAPVVDDAPMKKAQEVVDDAVNADNPVVDKAKSQETQQVVEDVATKVDKEPIKATEEAKEENAEEDEQKSE